MDRFPRFIDIEASGLGEDSYPVAVAWSDQTGNISRYLIDVHRVPSWNSWDPASEAIHGLDRERLRRNGWDPADVVHRLIEDCDGEQLWSDAPAFDQHWLDRLFAAVGEEQRFRLAHLDELLLETLHRPEQEMVYETVLHIEALKEQVRANQQGRHDAGYDVGGFIQLWELAHGQPAKMNHGAGPLPPRTDTGSFRSVRLRGV